MLNFKNVVISANFQKNKEQKTLKHKLCYNIVYNIVPQNGFPQIEILLHKNPRHCKNMSYFFIKGNCF